MEGAFRAHQLFAGCSEEELDSAGEGLEKYVMTKLYNHAFAALPEDVKHDEQLYEKMALVQQFIKPGNLDIKPDFQNETALLLAQKELQKINMHKAPRDKLVCILNCCKVINNLLLNASIVSNENPPGADEFLPVLIYVTLKANPPQLHSNLLYIQRYRRQSRLVSEAAYFFTNILSAESFIWNIDAKSLSMEEDEFEKNMESARALLSGLSYDLDSVSSQTDQEVMDSKSEALKDKTERNFPLPMLGSTKNTEFIKEIDDKPNSGTSKPSVPDLEDKGTSDPLKGDEVSGVFLKYPFLYAQVGDLTIKDVEALLNSYKQLVLKYVCLAKGLGLEGQSLQVGATETHAEHPKELEGTFEEDKNEKHEVIQKSDEGLNRESSICTDGSESNPGTSGHEITKHSEEEVQSRLENTE
ncbi:vacuolar protein sorting-associated protein 9A-like isoform X2 [Aristolochia californica]